jgi:hypothetical protein
LLSLFGVADYFRVPSISFLVFFYPYTFFTVPYSLLHLVTVLLYLLREISPRTFLFPIIGGSYYSISFSSFSSSSSSSSSFSTSLGENSNFSSSQVKLLPLPTVDLFLTLKLPYSKRSSTYNFLVSSSNLDNLIAFSNISLFSKET